MSLSSLLLPSKSKKSGKQLDSDLDAIFQAGASTSVSASKERGSAPTARSDGKVIVTKRKSDSSEVGDQGRNATGKRKRVRVENDNDGAKTAAKEQEDSPVIKKRALKAKSATPGSVGKTLAKARKTASSQPTQKSASRQGPSPSRSNRTTNENDLDGTEEEPDPARLVHESLSTSNEKGKATDGAKTRYAPPGETSEQRNSRTVFIGNLPLEVARTKSSQKRLRQHILGHVESAKVESIRFRSIPFQNPTAKFPDGKDNDPSTAERVNYRNAAAEPSTSKSLRSHDRDRITTWQETKKDKDKDDANKGDQKIFLTPQQKRKIAYINQEFHAEADTVNAYLVFAHPPLPESRPPNLPPLPPVMDPYEAARLTVEKCDGTYFMDRRIRVDHIVEPDKDDNHGGPGAGDPKLSIFVGNLDFASKEDDLRVFFEGVISAERGPPIGTSMDDGDEVGRDNRDVGWVTRVRIVRDKDTQLGKGFAYVQFADRECVDEVLSLEPKDLKFAKRSLRVQRCKNIAGGTTTSSKSAVKSSEKPSRTAVVVPKGNPKLGEQIAHLSKDARKQLKSSDPDRVARRLAKKKARITLARDGLKPRVKDRERVRKTAASKTSRPTPQVSKHRVRSEKSLAKRNTKR